MSADHPADPAPLPATAVRPSDRPGDERPPIMLDLDGVIAQPLFGRNLAISRELALPPLPADVRLAGPLRNRRSVRQTLDWIANELRYAGRRPLPDAPEGLAGIAAHRRPIIVTGRSWLVHGSIRRWLERHGLAAWIEEILPNNTNLRTAHYKLRIALSRGIAEQVDDDGSIAYFLACNGLSRVFLYDWPRNRNLPYPSNVIIVRNLREVADYLAGSRR